MMKIKPMHVHIVRMDKYTSFLLPARKIVQIIGQSLRSIYFTEIPSK